MLFRSALEALSLIRPKVKWGAKRPPVPGEPDPLQLRFHLFLEEPQSIHVAGNTGPQHPGPVPVGEHPQTGQLERKRFARTGRNPLRRQDILNPFHRNITQEPEGQMDAFRIDPPNSRGRRAG